MCARYSWSCAVILLAIGQVTLASEPIPLHFTEAVRYALANRVDMVIEAKKRERARHDIEEARGLFQPTLDVIADVQRTKIYDPFSGVTVQTEIGGQPISALVERTVPRYQSQIGLEAVVNIFAGGANTAQLKRASADYQALVAYEGLQRRAIILDIAKSFTCLRKAELRKRRWDRSLAVAKMEAAAAAAQHERGFISDADKDAKLLQLAEAEAQLILGHVEETECWQTYLVALGLSPTAYPLPSVTTLTGELGDIDFISFIEGNSAVPLRVAPANEEHSAAVAAANQARSEFLPNIDAFVRYVYAGRDEDKLGPALQQDKQEYIAGLRFRWNWYNGFRSSARYDRAVLAAEVKRLQIEQRRLEWISAQQDLERRIAKLETSIELMDKRLTVAQAQSKIHQRRRALNQITEAQYQSAMFSVTDIEEQLTSIKLDLDLARLELKMEHIGGRPSDRNISTPH